METPKSRRVSVTILAIAVIVALIVPSVALYYGLYTPEVSQLTYTKGVLNETTNKLTQAENNISSLEGTITSLNGEISNLQQQVSNLQSQNNQLQSQNNQLQSQLSTLQAPNIIGKAWAYDTCFLGYCTVDFYGAWANTGQNPSNNVIIEFTAYSQPGLQGTILCQTTYNLGLIEGQSMVSLDPSSGQYASCSYYGQLFGSVEWQIIQS